jgi:3-oxoadipate enol-lactonase
MNAKLNTLTTNDELNFFTTGDGYRIAYRFDGSPNKPVLVFSNSIGTTMNMWNEQIPDLSKHFQVLRYDFRGHGGSEVSVGAYSFDRLGRDVIELLNSLHISRVHFCGLSLGGMVGQWLGIHHPERIDRLILSNTSSYLGPADQWESLIDSASKADELSEFADMFMKNWFPSHMLEPEDDIVSKFRGMVTKTHPQGLAGCWCAVRDMDMRRTISLIHNPTLVVAGQYDTVTLPSHSELIAETIPNSKLVFLPVVHMSNVENPSAFLSTVFDFLLSK